MAAVAPSRAPRAENWELFTPVPTASDLVDGSPTSLSRSPTQLFTRTSRALALAEPRTIELADGTVATHAHVASVETRTVACTEAGDTPGAGQDECELQSHLKTELLSIDLQEKRMCDDGGFELWKIQMTKRRKQSIQLLCVELHGQTYDLLTGEGKLQFLFAKGQGLPLQGLLSLRYLSPLGGTWYVDQQPIDLDSRQPTGCCVVM